MSRRDRLLRLTNTQTVQLEQVLTLVEDRLQDIAILIRVRYGDDSQPAIRAGETAGAFQRLKWALERTELPGREVGST